MSHSSTKIWIVELTSLSRVLAALLFASLAFQRVPLALLVAIYLFAIATDLLDGYLARRLKVVTYFGKVLDLIGDKSLTIISLLYAAASGISIFPLALIASREIIMIGVRAVIVDGTQLLPTSRLLGGILASTLWGTTLFLLVAGKKPNLMHTANLLYWVCALGFVATLVVRAWLNFDRIKATLASEP